jgi:sterol desaturase/sphingolipid hydroxylase (fatty acid hydroxylase superfamily)
MKNFKIDNKGTVKLFSNAILERLSRTNFLFPVIFYSLLSLSFVVLAYKDEDINFLRTLFLLPLGWLFFTLIEYLVHRFLFHFKATTEKELDIQYKIHGVHHEFPRDKDRLVMPPVVSIVLVFGFYFLFYFIMGNPGKLFFSGFIAGYSSYLVIHYAVHALKPPNNFLKFFWKHHSMHHYDSVHSAFSVSMPLWDYVFNTLPRTAGKERKDIENKLPDVLET